MSEKLCACKACGQQIAAKAKTCPHCGARNKKSNPILLVVIVLVVVVAIIAAAGGGGDDKTYDVGDTAKKNDLAVTLVNVTESTGSEYNEPTDGNVFVLCEFEIVNNSDSEVTVSSLMSFEAYCDDYNCSLSFSALMEAADKNQLDGTIAPGKKLNGVIGYEVSKDWKELELHFTPDVLSDKEIVFIAKNN